VGFFVVGAALGVPVVGAPVSVGAVGASVVGASVVGASVGVVVGAIVIGVPVAVDVDVVVGVSVTSSVLHFEPPKLQISPWTAILVMLPKVTISCSLPVANRRLLASYDTECPELLP
jgi:hypothetical protein